MDEPTRLRDGRYLVQGRLGEGAQGVTYDAVDVREGRPVAIKRFDVRGAQSWKDVELAERETRVLATLDHPLLPRYVEHFEEGGALYLVMEKVEGETLDLVRRREGALPEHEVRRFLACADNALTYLHGRSSPMVHRDIKPRNVIRRPDGSYVMVDFGAVSDRIRARGGSTIVGTYGYMAPEQLQGRALATTDVYAVGATALAALTGAEPETLPHTGLRVDVRTALDGKASEAMVVALERMLEPDPDARAQSLAAALVPLHSAPAGVAPAPTTREPLAPEAASTVDENRLVRSLVGLLWVLWGLGWAAVVPLLAQLGQARLLPTIMFGWLAATLVVTWHKGAMIRAALRALKNESARAERSPQSRARVDDRDYASPSRAARPRIEVLPQVRVHTSDVASAAVLDDTQVASVEARRAQKQR